MIILYQQVNAGNNLVIQHFFDEQESEWLKSLGESKLHRVFMESLHPLKSINPKSPSAGVEHDSRLYFLDIRKIKDILMTAGKVQNTPYKDGDCVILPNFIRALKDLMKTTEDTNLLEMGDIIVITSLR